MNILLIGFMGSGKSSVGKRLAGKLNYDFIDLDAELEAQEGISVEDIFAQKGEAHFREIESQWLYNFRGDQKVISLGGGTPCFGENINRIAEIGTVIYLVLSPEALANRLINSKTQRPLIKPYQDDLEKLKLFIREKLEERKPFYEQASILFEASNLGSEKLDRLVELINLNS